jgi:predicted mannosyl-3-phosphoglycerate phosphatase (HAD superfamily)
MRMEMAHDGVHSCASGTLVIFTRVDGLLRERATAPCDLSRDALTALISTRVPLVLVSDADAPDIRDIQRELGLLQPFISRSGAALHIPPEYFTHLDDMPVHDGGWELFSFDTVGPAAAMRLLGALFLARGHDKILTVGLGCDASDCSMLAAVDIPIVVRDHRHDQSALLRHVPGAYLTTATGAAGWLEAVVGPPR